MNVHKGMAEVPMKRGIILIAPLFLLALALAAIHPAAAFGKEAAAAPAAAQQQEIPLNLSMLMDKIQMNLLNIDRKLDAISENFLEGKRTTAVPALEKLFQQGRDYMNLKDYMHASDAFYSMVTHPSAPQTPDYIDGVYYLAECLFQLGDNAGAGAYYKKIFALGPQGKYYGRSLMRLMEVCLRNEDWKGADGYFELVKKQFPKDEDSSQAWYLMGKRYYMGKYYYEHGDLKQSRGMLEQIPSGNYYGMAQYLLGVSLVQEGKLKEASELFAKLSKSIQDAGIYIQQKQFTVRQDSNMAHRDELRDAVHLTLGRVYYDLNNFPQALDEYMHVSPASPHYADALAEAMWVYVTRNDMVTQQIAKQRSQIDRIRSSYRDFLTQIAAAGATKFSGIHAAEIDDVGKQLLVLQSDLKDMEAKKADSMAKGKVLYDALLKADPDSSRAPEAEVLVGYIYSQSGNYADADKWFADLKDKYSKMKNAVSAASNKFATDDDYLQFLKDILTEQSGAKLAAGSKTGSIPPQVRSWIAEKATQTSAYRMIRDLQDQQKNLKDMTQIKAQIEKLLSGGSGKDDTSLLGQIKKAIDVTRKKDNDVFTDISKARAMAATLDAANKAKVTTALDQDDAGARNMQAKIATTEKKVSDKFAQRQQVLAKQFAALAANIQPLYEQTRQLEQMTSKTAAVAGKSELDGVTHSINSILLQASLGELDSAWRKGEKYDAEKREILGKQEDEILSLMKGIQ